MAEVVGHNGIHAVRGFLCDLCGRVCDPEAEELNALDCTYANCPKECAVYHQDCLEKYLKSIRLEKNRKTGFRCPRGTGKGSRYVEQPCPGKIDKSHPIHIRNDNAKKRRKAQMPPPPPEPKPKPEPKAKTKAKEEPPKAKAKAKALSAEEQVRLEKQKLQAAAQALRRDLGLTSSAPVAAPAKSTVSKAPASREYQTLEEYEAAKLAGSRAAPVVANAWTGSKPGAATKPAVEAPPARRQAPPSGWSAAAAGPPPPPPARKIPPPPAQQRLGPTLKLTKTEEKRAAPVGMEPPSPPAEDGSRLSKAQRKNKRRAERKALERMSVASSEMVSEMDAGSQLGEGDGGSASPIAETPEVLLDSLEEDCAQALMVFKAQSLVTQLRSLGFPDWRCVAAVMAHGSDLEAAVTFLLEGGAPTEAAARELLGEESELPLIDISPELARLLALAEELRLDVDRLRRQVVTFEGDLEKACSSLFEVAGALAGDSLAGSPPRDDRSSTAGWRSNSQSDLLPSEFSHLAVQQGGSWHGSSVSQHASSNGGHQGFASWGTNSPHVSHLGLPSLSHARQAPRLQAGGGGGVAASHSYLPTVTTALDSSRWSQPGTEACQPQEAGELDIDNLLASLIAH